VEPHHFDAALARGKNSDAAPAPTLLYTGSAHPTFLKQAKVNIGVRTIFNPDFFLFKLVYDTVSGLEPEPSQPEPSEP
jgi:hypothetical protein